MIKFPSTSSPRLRKRAPTPPVAQSPASLAQAVPTTTTAVESSMNLQRKTTLAQVSSWYLIAPEIDTRCVGSLARSLAKNANTRSRIFLSLFNCKFLCAFDPENIKLIIRELFEKCAAATSFSESSSRPTSHIQQPRIVISSSDDSTLLALSNEYVLCSQVIEYIDENILNSNVS